MYKILKRSFEIKKRKVGDNSIEGYAFGFDSESENGFFGIEKFSRDLKIDFDKKVFLLRDHDSSKPLGKLDKNMELSLDEYGLFFKVSPLPNTQLARDTRELIKSGILTGASVGFSADKRKIRAR